MAQEFKDAMEQWITIKKQLATIRGDLKIMNTQEKGLREFISQYMKNESITTCNVSDKSAKVTLNIRKTKSTFNRDLVRKGLLKYFRGDESLVDKVFELIDEEIEVQERSSISLKSL